MSAAADAKFKEGLRHQVLAEKAITKTLFKWAVDWEVGAAEFNQAGANFKAAKAAEQAREAFVRAAECLTHNRQPLMAAVAYENAAQMAADLKRLDEAADLYGQASTSYVEGGNSDRAAAALVGGARALAPANADRSLALYVQACDLYEDEGREQFANETFVATVNAMLKQRRLEDALRMLMRHAAVLRKMDRKAALAKVLLSQVVVQLCVPDDVGAQATFERAHQDDGFAGSDEAKAGHELFAALASGDPAAVTAVTRKAAFIYLDNEVANLAKTIRPTGEGGGGANSLA